MCIMRHLGCGYLVKRLAASKTSIQLCGPLVVELNGERVEARLPGRQGRLLFGYLAGHRERSVRRGELAEVIWPEKRPTDSEGALSPLISKLRRTLGETILQGRSELRLTLPPSARIDIELASARLHDAESAIAQGRYVDAWLPARVAWSVCDRDFMAGYDADWIEEKRRSLEDQRLRALECIAQVGLRLGSAELPAATRAARSLVDAAPYRESGHLYLMEALAAESNVAEALRVYERLRCLLRDELGIAPGDQVAALHKRLLER